MAKLLVLTEQLDYVEFEEEERTEIEREHVHVQLDLFDDIIDDEEWGLMMDEQYRLELMEEQAFLDAQHHHYYEEMENMWEFNQD